MHPVAHALTTPDKPAYIMAATGETVTYRDLDARANQGAHLLRALGLTRGYGIAVLMDNSPRYLEVMWAAERTGVYCTCLSSKLTASEAAYIIRDGDCRVLIASEGCAEVAAALVPMLDDVRRYVVDGAIDGYASYEAARDAKPATPIADPSPGGILLYRRAPPASPRERNTRCRMSRSGPTSRRS